MMNKPNNRDRLMLFSFLGCFLGGGVLIMLVLTRIIDYTCSGCLGKPLPGRLEGLIGLFGSIAFCLLCFYLGLVAWFLILKPFFSRDDLKPYIIGPPYVPVISKIGIATFNLIYPEPSDSSKSDKI